MTYSEYEQKFTEVMSNPDTALTAIKPVLDELKGDIESLDALKGQVETQEARIRDLQDTNLKLFLSQTSAATEDEPGTSETVKAVDSFFDDFGKENE